MIKLPTYKELGLNVKALLWNYRPKTFAIFKAKYGEIFRNKLWFWIINNNDIKDKKSYYLTAWKVIFYYGFIAFKQEINLMEMLENEGFNVSSTPVDFDAIFGVDLIARKGLKAYYLQVKSYGDYKKYELKKLKALENKSKTETIFAVCRYGKWSFKNSNFKTVSIF